MDLPQPLGKIKQVIGLSSNSTRIRLYLQVRSNRRLQYYLYIYIKKNIYNLKMVNDPSYFF
jgi:hypothetical protein